MNTKNTYLSAVEHRGALTEAVVSGRTPSASRKAKGDIIVRGRALTLIAEMRGTLLAFHSQLIHLCHGAAMQLLGSLIIRQTGVLRGHYTFPKPRGQTAVKGNVWREPFPAGSPLLSWKPRIQWVTMTLCWWSSYGGQIDAKPAHMKKRTSINTPWTQLMVLHSWPYYRNKLLLFFKLTSYKY